MAKNVVLYDILISCPGDVKEEINIINSVVERFNQQFADALGISLRTKHWSKSSYAQSGGKPQDLLNEQFVKDCDAAIAIFWSRFGTPTDEYGSGTEEEIELMIREKKQVFMYFSDKPIPPSNINQEQYTRVQDFKKKYESKGIYSCYNEIGEFEKLLYAHLSQHFLTVKKVDEIITERKPHLKIQSYASNKLNDELIIQPFFSAKIERKESLLKRIKEKFIEIEKINVGKCPIELKNIQSTWLGGVYKSVSIEENVKNYISMLADVMNIPLSETFFKLGNLSENSLDVSLIGGKNLQGTEDEKKKYWAIYELYKIIKESMSYLELGEMFFDLYGIQIVIQNDGTMFDEDIDVELVFPKEMLIVHNELPIPQSDIFKPIKHQCVLEDIVGIQGTELFSDYASSCRKQWMNNIGSKRTVMPFFERDFAEEYKEDLDAIFSYEYYEGDNTYLLKLHIDYIRQHAAVAFPTWIFINKMECYNNIKFRIRSKNDPDIHIGELNILDIHSKQKHLIKNNEVKV